MFHTWIGELNFPGSTRPSSQIYCRLSDMRNQCSSVQSHSCLCTPRVGSHRELVSIIRSVNGDSNEILVGIWVTSCKIVGDCVFIPCINLPIDNFIMIWRKIHAMQPYYAKNSCHWSWLAILKLREIIYWSDVKNVHGDKIAFLSGPVLVEKKTDRSCVVWWVLCFRQGSTSTILDSQLK